MHHSHTPVATGETADRDLLRLVPAATLGLAERLAGRLDGHLARFAEHMGEGLLAASVAVGLDVMAELMVAEVTDLTGPKGKHNPARTAKVHGSHDGTVTLGGRAGPGPPPAGAHGRRRRARAGLDVLRGVHLGRPARRQGWSPGCWRGCRPAATRSGSNPLEPVGASVEQARLIGGRTFERAGELR